MKKTSEQAMPPLSSQALREQRKSEAMRENLKRRRAYLQEKIKGDQEEALEEELPSPTPETEGDTPPHVHSL